MEKEKGFTLVELIVVLTIFLTVGGMIITVLTISLRGTNKTNVMLQVKQNGDFALSQMERNIRYADNLNAPLICYPPVTTSSITITSVSDGGTTVYSCPATATGSISSNSAALIDTSTSTVSDCSFTCTKPQIGGAPTMQIQFTLNSKSQGGLFETQTTLPFQSTVFLRNVGN